MRFYMAPMEGVTTSVFRKAYHRHFPAFDKYFTPFVTPNDNGLLTPKEYRDVAPEYNEGLFTVPQILTNHSDGFIRTARTLKSMGYEEINLNLGCPAGTVVAKGRGSGFLSHQEELDRFLFEIFEELVDIRISVKTRIGRHSPEEFEKLLDIYRKYPICELIIHPRVRDDYYRNEPRMERFEKGLSEKNWPVCYNGDVFSVSRCEALIQAYPKLDRIMLGRGVIANPGLLMEIQKHTPLTTEAFTAFHEQIYGDYQKQFLKDSGERVVLFKMKELWSYMIALFPESKRWEKKIKKANRLSEYEASVAELLRECPISTKEGYGRITSGGMELCRRSDPPQAEKLTI